MAKRGSTFEDVRVVGGPHGKNVEIWVGGENLTGITHAELILDVNDAVILKTTKIVNVVFEGKATHVDAVKVKVNDLRKDGWVVVAESTADTVWDALFDCGRQLQLAARTNGQGVAPGGTVVEPDGRPPGQ